MEWWSVWALIGGFPGTTLEPDRLAWGHHKDGVFSVNRLYNWGHKRSAGRSIGPWNTIWKSVAPTKVMVSKKNV